jgi:hypothetical protein
MATQKIIFDDGRLGIQTTDEDGRLTEVVVTRLADGRRCQLVYARRSDLMARVFSLNDLGNCKWQIAE